MDKKVGEILDKKAGAHGCRSAARVLFDWEVGAVGRGVR